MVRKTRSPNYPALGLGDAVEAIRRVSETGYRRTSPEDVAEALGHKSLSGTARVKVSALRKYGLLEPEGDGLKVSDDALSIINLPPEDPEHIEALRKAALRPALFAELSETYGDNPPADGVLRNFLLRKDFSPKAAEEVIRLYRDTMGLVSRGAGHYTPADESVDEQQEAQMQRVQQEGGARRDQPGGADARASVEQGSFEEYLTIPIKGRKIRLLVEGEVTAEILTSLGRHLRLLRDDLPGAPVEGQEEADTEEDSVIPKESADSLLDEETGENGHSTQ